jgi:HD-GYP domain-containing protein (c-di-GMP phosphodiesterase class II)
MGEIQSLTEKINHFLKERKLPELVNIPFDFILLYKEALKSVWQNRNMKDRESFSFEIGKMLSKYLNTQKITEIFRESAEELDKKYPPVVDFIDIYRSIQEEYSLLIKDFFDNQTLNFEMINSLLKKILLLIENDKNKLISFLGYNIENYNYHVNHGVNSTIIALIGAIELKFTEDDIKELGIAGLFHDIGMRKVPDNIINKKDKLEDQEYELIKSHPVLAFKSLEEKKIFSRDILEGILQHHEKNNGNGYPQRLKSDKINKLAKILSISDAIESQISFRAYRERRSSYNAIKEILKNNDNSFDNRYLEAFINVFSIYPPGTLVQLNNNSIGTVYSVVPYFPLKPQVKIIIDEFGDKTNKEIIKDLSNEKELFIVRVINDAEYISK